MAFSEQEEARMRELLAAFENGKRISELEPTDGLTGATLVEVMDASGETRRMELEQAVAEASNPIAGRWWDESKATTKAAGWFGSLEALRKLPATLGLGRYLVADDRTMRKLDPTDSRRFEDGSPAALDGSMGQCMWCWSRPWYFTHWKEGNRSCYAITLKPLEGRKSYRIPVGGVSWLGAGVMDRTEMKLCSVISEDERYRGGRGTALALATEPDHPMFDTPQATMLGMAATQISSNDFGLYARKRGEGWDANWFVAQAAVEILLLVIMGERDTQAAFNAELDADGLYHGGFGAGVTNIDDGEWNKYNGRYPLVPTNTGVDLGDRMGLVEYSLPASANALDKDLPKHTFHVPNFLGLICAGYGHLWNIVRGIIINMHKDDMAEVFVAKSMESGYNFQITEDLIKVAEMPISSGYIKRISMEGLCMMPTEIGGSSETYFSDYLLRSPENAEGLRTCEVGGSSSFNKHAGAFAVNVYHQDYTKGTDITSPLCFFVEDPIIEI